MQILLLGPPTLLYKNEEWQIKRRQQRLLLFFLALRGERVGRSDLILHFWPDEPETDARRHLREALSRLRSQLPHADMLLTDQDWVSLNPELISCDAVEFNSLIGQVEQAVRPLPEHEPLPEPIFLKFQRAADLWRTPIFWEGAQPPEEENLDAFIFQRKEELERAHQQVVERMVKHHTLTGDLETALRWLKVLLQRDALNDELQSQTLGLLIQLGRRAEALSYCAYLEDLYRRDGQNELPEPLLSQCVQVRKRASALAPRVEWPLQASVRTPFVGRQEQMEQLRRAYRRNQAAVILSEAGAGKSRLAREFYNLLDPAPRLLLAVGRRLAATLPFQPLIDMFNQSLTSDEIHQIDENLAQMMATLIPKIMLERSILRPERVPSERFRQQMLEGFVSLLHLMSQENRVLLVIEDAQWCDDATLAALAFILQHGALNERGMLLVLARKGEANSWLDLFLSDANVTPYFEQVKLPRLTVQEIERLARYTLGDVPAALIDQLDQDTGGNPLYLIETLRARLDSRDTELENLPPSSVQRADNLSGLIHERLRALSGSAFKALAAAAVIGNAFSPALLERTTQLQADQIVDALEELESANLIQPNPHTTPSITYRFIHDRNRETILTSMSLARKRLLNLRVAHMLEESVNDQSALIAEHYEQAGEQVEAFRYWLKAAQYARGLFARAEAFAAFERAETLLNALDLHLDEQSIYQLYVNMGEMAFDVVDAATMQRVYANLIHLGEKRLSPLLLGTAHSGLAHLANLNSTPDSGLEAVNAAILFLTQTPNQLELAKAYNRKGMLLILKNQLPEAQIAYEQALEISQQTDPPQIIETRATAQYQLAFILTLRGQPEAAIAMGQEALVNSILLAHHAPVARARLMLALSNYYTAHFIEAQMQYRHGLIIANAMRNWRTAAYLHAIAGRTELIMGNLDDAWQHVQEGLTICQKSQFVPILTELYCVAGDLCQTIGDLPQALDLYARGIQDAPSHNYQTLDCLLHRGFALVSLGKAESGLRLIEESIQLAREYDLGIIYRPAETARLIAWEMTDQLDKLEAYQQARPGEAEQPLPSSAGYEQLLQARLQIRRGDPAGAYTALLRLADEARQTRHFPLEMMARKEADQVRQRHQLTQAPPCRLAETLEECFRRTKTDWIRDTLAANEHTLFTTRNFPRTNE